jgi:hypothetical protein
LRRHCSRHPGRQSLLGMTGPQFRAWFLDLCKTTSLGRRLRFTPYSLRRGGATYHFAVTGSLGSLTQRGRWSSSRTARIYLAEAQVEAEQQMLRPHERSELSRAGALLPL